VFPAVVMMCVQTIEVIDITVKALARSVPFNAIITYIDETGAAPSKN
jgi:hypothetical protein